MSIGQIVQIVGAFLLLSWTIRTALLWSTAGITGAIKGIGAFLLVIGIIAIIGVPLVDMVYVRFRTELPKTKMAKDAEEVIGVAVDVVGEKPAAGWLAAPEGEQAVEVLPWGAPEGIQPTTVPSVRVQLTSVPSAAPQVAPQVAQPQRILIEDSVERASCWREAALRAGLTSSTSGGASWFPAGTTCSLRWGLGTLWGRDRFWVTCLELGLQDLEITKGLGGQLAKLAGQSGGSFYGTGNWPNQCYVEVQPSVPSVPPSPSPTSVPVQPTATPVPIVLTPIPSGAVLPQLSPTAVPQTGTPGQPCATGAIWSQMCNRGGPPICVVRGTCRQVTPTQ